MPAALRRLIREEVEARVRAAFPLAANTAPDPEAIASARLPAFAVRVIEAQSARRGMGSDALEVSDRVEVAFWTEGGPDLRDVLEGHAATLEAAVLAAPADLGGLVRSILPAGSETLTAPGASRVGRVDLTFLADYHD